jgi:hypothetical protein
MKNSKKIINDISEQILRGSLTETIVLERLRERYGWSDSISTFTDKLQRGSFSYREIVEFAAVLGYDVVWKKRRR